MTNPPTFVLRNAVSIIEGSNYGVVIISIILAFIQMLYE
jgi:hypothetical protein